MYFSFLFAERRMQKLVQQQQQQQQHDDMVPDSTTELLVFQTFDQLWLNIFTENF